MSMLCEENFVAFFRKSMSVSKTFAKQNLPSALFIAGFSIGALMVIVLICESEVLAKISDEINVNINFFMFMYFSLCKFI
jgi:hypothetical protein